MYNKANNRRSSRAFTIIEALVATVVITVAGVAILNSTLSVRNFNGYAANQGIAIRKLNDTVSYYQATGSTRYDQYDPTGVNLASPYINYTISMSSSSMPYIQKTQWYQTYSWMGQTMTNSVVLARPDDSN